MSEIDKAAHKHAGDRYGYPTDEISMQSEVVYIEYSAGKEDFKDGAKWAIERIRTESAAAMKRRMEQTFIAIYGDYISKDDLMQILDKLEQSE